MILDFMKGESLKPWYSAFIYGFLKAARY